MTLPRRSIGWYNVSRDRAQEEGCGQQGWYEDAPPGRPPQHGRDEPGGRGRGVPPLVVRWAVRLALEEGRPEAGTPRQLGRRPETAVNAVPGGNRPHSAISVAQPRARLSSRWPTVSLRQSPFAGPPRPSASPSRVSKRPTISATKSSPNISAAPTPTSAIPTSPVSAPSCALPNERAARPASCIATINPCRPQSSLASSRSSRLRSGQPSGVSSASVMASSASCLKPR